MAKGNPFIDRPVMASVIAIIMTLAGLLALGKLPVAQFPQIAPPSVEVSATYPGATAETVEETVATPIEQQINGAQDMLYMSSRSSNDGRMTLTVTFDIARDLDLAAVDVQNRLSLATPKLPSDVVKQGVSVRKKSPDMVLVVSINALDPALDDLFLSNYASINILDALARIKGVGGVTLVGAGDYGMRVWVDPDKLARLGLTAGDLIRVIEEQNLQAPAGMLGQPPAPPGTPFQYSVEVKGRLSSPEEFRDIIVKANVDGSIVRMRDVASVELGPQDYMLYGRLNQNPSALLILYQLPGANALEVAREARAIMEDLKKNFPAGVDYSVPFDSTKFVEVSIAEVVKTLEEAVILVFIVVFIFLQNVRATLIPLITVPVSLIGTLMLFGPLGFSINTLTLFGLVLAIGIVVDDAIVVVEAAMHHIEQGHSPREATRMAMAEITGPVVATTLALISVFVPVAFMTGITGVLYKQFALTLAVSVFISSINALTLSPALCAILLKPPKPGGGKGPMAAFFRGFNWVFDRLTLRYLGLAGFLGRKLAVVGLVMLGLYLGTVHLAGLLPTGFVPNEDEGYYFVEIQLPPGASQERTRLLLADVEKTLMDLPGVQDVISLGSLSMTTSVYASNMASCIAVLTPWDAREDKSLWLESVLGKSAAMLSARAEAVIFPFAKPPIPGMGNVGGVQFELQNRAGGTPQELDAQTKAFAAALRQDPRFASTFTAYNVNTPRIKADVDREKVKALGVTLDSVFQTLQTFLGGVYINDFNMFGRSYKVMLQAIPDFRATPQDLGRFFVHGSGGNGGMLPLSTLVDTSSSSGPLFMQRYNLYRTAELNVTPAPGVSTGMAIQGLREMAAANLPQGFAYDWTGTAYQEVKTGGEAAIIFGLAVLFCFLVLAAQYESWALPFAVMLSVPLAALGAFLGQWIAGRDLNVYAQIGLVMLIGLAAKNAILIVEFAAEEVKKGRGLFESAMDAARLRFRPILMTSFAFILGVVPLVLATGAGAASRVSLGVSVFAGMLFATVCGVFVVPALFIAICKLTGYHKQYQTAPAPAAVEDAPPHA